MFPIALLFTLAGEPDQQSADLDGDGQPDLILVDTPAPDKKSACEIRIGEARFRPSGEWEEGCTASIVDLDSRDKSKQLVVECNQANDYKGYWILRFENKTLSVIGEQIGQIPSPPEISGNGIVLFDRWEGFFNRRFKLAPDKKGMLLEAKAELYYVGSTVKVKESFPILAFRGKPDVLAKLKAGSEITIVAWDPSPPCKQKEQAAPIEPCDLFLVRASTGLLGWVTLEVLDKNTELGWAG